MTHGLSHRTYLTRKLDVPLLVQYLNDIIKYLGSYILLFYHSQSTGFSFTDLLPHDHMMATMAPDIIIQTL